MLLARVAEGLNWTTISLPIERTLLAFIGCRQKCEGLARVLKATDIAPTLTGTSRKFKFMIPEEIEALLDGEPPETLRVIAGQYIGLLWQLDQQSKLADQAFKQGDIDEARRRLLACITGLDRAVQQTVADKDGIISWEGFLGGFALLSIMKIIEHTQEGRRHWLTALHCDELAVAADDSGRAILEANAAAALDAFAERGNVDKWADQIAKKMSDAGFRTKRGPPSASTIKKWRSSIRKQLARPSKNAHHRRRVDTYQRARAVMIKESSPDLALKVIGHLCNNFVPLLVGAGPVRP